MSRNPAAVALIALAVAGAVFLGPVGPAAPAAPQVRAQSPGYYRMMLGDFEVTALLDGTHPFPAYQVLTRAKAAPGALFNDTDPAKPMRRSPPSIFGRRRRALSTPS